MRRKCLQFDVEKSVISVLTASSTRGALRASRIRPSLSLALTTTPRFQYHRLYVQPRFLYLVVCVCAPFGMGGVGVEFGFCLCLPAIIYCACRNKRGSFLHAGSYAPRRAFTTDPRCYTTHFLTSLAIITVC